MLTAGRRRGGKPGTGLSGRSARLTLGRFSAALEAAVLEGKLVRNVARLVKPPEHTPRERETWSKTEVRKFLAKASSDRLHVAWRLSLYGLRRGEVIGLRWSDIDLRAGILTVNQARVLVEYRVRIEEPKSRNGKRTLPLDGELVAALTALRKRQLEEGTIAGTAYRSGLAELEWYQGGEYVITDEAGTPVHPEWYSDEFGRLLRRAGLRRITLHDSRHTTLTLMEGRGVASDATFRTWREDGAARDAGPGAVGWRSRPPNEPAGQDGRDRTMLRQMPGCCAHSRCIRVQHVAARATKKAATRADATTGRPSR